MNEAVGQVLAFGLAVGLSPIPVIGITLMLTTSRARSNGPAFLAGWVVGLTVVAALVIFVAEGSGASEGGDPATWVSLLKLALGATLIGLVPRQLRGEGEKAEPGWMRSIDSVTAGRAAGLGLALSALNPKNLLLIVAAATSIAQTGADTGSELVALAVFVLIGTLGTGIPVGIYFALGERSAPILARLKAWMTRHGAAIMAVVPLLIGAKLLGDGLGAL